MTEIGASYDAISDFITKLGSSSDPNTTARIIQSCQQDTDAWYANGGVAATICEFWADQMATGIVVTVSPQSKATTALNRAKSLEDFLNAKLTDLDIVPTLRRAEVKAAVVGGSPLIMHRDGNKRLLSVELGHSKALEPIIEAGARGALISFLHTRATRYRVVGTNKVLGADDIVPFLGKMPIITSDHHYYETSDVWGGRWIGAAVVQAAKQYEMALAASNVLLQLKSFQEIGIKGLFEKLSGADADQKQQEVNSMLRFLTTVSSNLSIRLTDMDESESKIIERSLAGVADAVLSLRNNLLIQCPDIPEIYLCQYREKGGITEGGAQADEERVDAKATMLWRQRWHNPIRSIIRALLLSAECPSANFQICDVKIDRLSGYSPRPIDQANAEEIKLRTEIARWEFEQRKKQVVT